MEWLNQLSRVLSYFSEELFLPQTLFITVDDDVAPLFARALEKEDFSTFTLSPAKLRIITLTTESLDKTVTWAPSLPHDPFVGLISSFANRLRYA